MKNFLSILLVVAVSMAAGAYLHKCQCPKGDAVLRDTVCDTVIVRDTIMHEVPVPVQTRTVEYRHIRVPVIKTDTMTVYAEHSGDSATVALPVTQNVYESKDYKAWVSGIDPRLDSIRLYRQRETIITKTQRERWHIGPQIGYGYDGRRGTPYIGIGIVYSIFSF